MDTLKQKWKIIVGILVVIVLFGVQLFDQPTEGIRPKSPVVVQEEELEYIYVDIKGQVAYPGVYKVIKETRLFQLIQQAGGLREHADDLAVNLSMKLYDQTVVYIPHINEEYPSIHEGGSSSSGVVNINQASKEVLMSLPGVGEVTANDIIAYRNEHSGFSKIEDLMNVSGIGEATFERLKDLISIS